MHAPLIFNDPLISHHLPSSLFFLSIFSIFFSSRCAAGLPDIPWACGLLNFSLPFLASDVFVIEMLTDSVQLYLHSGCVEMLYPKECFPSHLLLNSCVFLFLLFFFQRAPEYNNDTASYVSAWGRNMTAALQTTVLGKQQLQQQQQQQQAGGGGGGGSSSSSSSLGKTGLFGAGCFSHTSFYYYSPFLVDSPPPPLPPQERTLVSSLSASGETTAKSTNGSGSDDSGYDVNFVFAFADWLYERGQLSSPYLADWACCDDEAGVTFNPTCPE
jgi:hypothetical protein